MGKKTTLAFDDLKVGSHLGSYTEAIDGHLLEQWRALYPWDLSTKDEAPCSVAMALIMRAYMQVVTPRPPGNIHAEQLLEMLSPLKLGRHVTTRLSCVEKYLRHDRRFIEFAAEITDEESHEPLVRARLKLIWAK